MILIGIHGKANVGKDTAASFLVASEGFQRMAFADPLKKIAAILFNTDANSFETQLGKASYDTRWEMTRRKMVQLVGTEMVRDCLGQDHWIKLLETMMPQRVNSKVVVTDVRFQNELQWILDKGGFIIHIESLSRNTIIESSHRSEAPLDMSTAIKYNRYFHYQNDGTMKQFRIAMLDVYESILDVVANEKVKKNGTI